MFDWHGRYQPLNHFIKGREALLFASVLKGREVWFMEHFGRTAGFPGAVVTHNEACSMMLDPFKSIDVCLVVGIPYDGSILMGRSN